MKKHTKIIDHLFDQHKNDSSSKYYDWNVLDKFSVEGLDSKHVWNEWSDMKFFMRLSFMKTRLFCCRSNPWRKHWGYTCRHNYLLHRKVPLWSFLFDVDSRRQKSQNRRLNLYHSRSIHTSWLHQRSHFWHIDIGPDLAEYHNCRLQPTQGNSIRLAD